jgi:fibro-slime domain-containing protein
MSSSRDLRSEAAGGNRTVAQSLFTQREIAMTSRVITTAATYGLLGAAAIVTLLLPEDLSVPEGFATASPPDTILLNGIIRDFKADHSDFDVVPPGGNGHFVGVVDALLPNEHQPLLVAGGGAKVTAQWRDDAGREIAPNLADVTAGPVGNERLGLRVNDSIKVEKDCYIDGFNSDLGPYGEYGNYGADAITSTNSTASDRVTVQSKGLIRGPVNVGFGGNPSTVIDNEGTITGTVGVLSAAYPMIDVLLPEAPDLAGLVATLTVSGTTTLTGDTNDEDDSVPLVKYYNTLKVNPGGVLRIEGELQIRVDTEFSMDKGSLVLLPGGSVTIYAAGGANVRIKESLVATDEADPSGVLINAAGAGDLVFDKNAYAYLTITAPERKLEIKDGSHVYGSFIGDDLDVHGGMSAMHVDMSTARAGSTSFACMVRESIDLDDAVVDGFDSNDGAYGGANVEPGVLMANVYQGTKMKGHVKLDHNADVSADILIGPGGSAAAAVQITGGSVHSGEISSLSSPNTIPSAAPPSIGASVGDVTWKEETVDLVADLHCKRLKLEKKVILNVHGNRVIVCDDKMEVLDLSDVNLMPGATLKVFFKKELTVKKNSTFNMNTGNPQLVSIRAVNGSKGKVKIEDNASVAAWITGGKSDLHVHSGGKLYGSFAGKKAHVKQGEFHVDMANLTFCVAVDDVAGATGVAGNGGIADATSFSQWFDDVLGVNQAAAHAITLTRDFAGVYEYIDDAFYPIDGRLFGNESQPNNNHFTYAIAAEFTYAECGGQFVEFEGGDGAWLFINHRLVMDLGGMDSGVPQYIDIDRLGLMPGATYDLHLFYAQRRSAESIFRLRTNIELDSSAALPTVTAMFD